MENNPFKRGRVRKDPTLDADAFEERGGHSTTVSVTTLYSAKMQDYN
jgi:hypothetical protein